MKNKIVFVAPCLRSGGAERVMVLLANSFAEKGYETEFLLTMADVVSYEPNRNILIIVNKGKRNPLGQIKFIREYMRKNRNATFISFFTYQNLYTLIAKVFLNVKVVISERNDPRKTLYGRKELEMLRLFLYSFAYRVVFQTEEAKQCFPNRIQRKSVIIFNPLSPDLPDIFSGKREKRVVAVARLNKQKNLPMMISGMAEYLTSYPEVCLEIYGEGDPRDPDMKSELIELASQKGICDQVKFKGFVHNVTEKIRNASIYVSTSNYEGISNSMLEALAMGLPCICTDCPVGGARMFVKEGINGYLVSVGDERAFKDALYKVEFDNNMRTKCYEEAVELRKMLSVNAITEQWEKAIM